MSIPLVGAEPPKPEDVDQRLKRLTIVLLYVAITLASIFAIRAVYPIVQWLFNLFAPFLIGLVLAYVMNPVVNFIERKLHVRRAGALGLVALVGVVIVLALTGILIYLIMQLDDVYKFLTTDFPAQVQQIQKNLSPPVRSVVMAAQDYLYHINWRDAVSMVLPKVGRGTVGVAQEVAGSVFSFVAIIIVSFLVAIITFYYLLDFHKIPRVIRILIPDRHEPRALQVLNNMNIAVGGFLRGQLIDCAAVGTLVAILMLIWGPRKWALLIGFVAGAVNFIPYLGPIGGALPAVLWALFTPALQGTEHLWKALYISLCFMAVQFIDNHLFQPNIVGKYAQLHPLAVLLALFIGAHFGVAGMVMAVPTACVVRVLVKEFWWDKLDDEERRREILASEAAREDNEE